MRQPWKIGPVEVPTRLVLAPMAGVSVQAFRRQGRRFGAGLVCSEMVSCAGIEYRNEKTIGYLRVASDEHPVVLQNGTATFLVQYYGSGDRLSGHGALASVASADIDTHVEKSSFLEDRDWLVVDAKQGGLTEELGLSVAGTMARTLPVDTVEETEIDSMKLSSEGAS